MRVTETCTAWIRHPSASPGLALTATWQAHRVDGVESLDHLAADLAHTLPAAQRSAIVHGDYRLDNTILHSNTPGRISAVLDWEMATHGDPLADLVLLLVYWSQADDDALRAQSAVVSSVAVLHGFPHRPEVATMYTDRSGLDLTELPW